MSENPEKYKAKKSLGQNFLIDQNTCHRIVDSIPRELNARILEIGPGQGALTRFLAERDCDLSVIEKDTELARRLERDYLDITVYNDDALEFSWKEFGEQGDCFIIGNLPYNVGSKLIWDIVSQTPNLVGAVFMVQHEVATRLTAEHGCKAYGGLTVWIKNYAKTRYLFKVPPTVFRPKPKVDSGVVLFTPLSKNPTPSTELNNLIKILFQKRRKQLRSILKQQWTPELEEWVIGLGIAPTDRPENISPPLFLKLAEKIASL